MFKDVYKSANDDISPDPLLLESILNSKPKKKTRIYQYSTVAAACVILVCAIAAYPKLETSLEQKAGIIMESSYTSDYSEDITSSTPAAEKASPPTDVPTAAPTQEIVQKKAANNTKSTTTPTQQATNQTAVPYTSSQKADINNIIQAAEKEASHYQAAPASINDTAPITEAGLEEAQAMSLSEEETAEAHPQNSGTARKASGGSSASSGDSGSSGGSRNAAVSGTSDGSAIPSTAYSNDMSFAAADIKAVIVLTKEEAIEIAEKAFLEDFGEEFVKSTEIKVSGTENYTITRFNDTAEKTITVSLDGTVTKNY